MRDLDYGICARVTHQCNLQCSFCINEEQMQSDKKISKLFYQNLIDLIENSIKNNKPYNFFNISGGEPFLYPDVLEDVLNIYLEYSENKIPIKILTNGTKINQLQVDMLNQFPIITTTISIDGFKGERSIFNLVNNGCEGLFQIDVIKKLKNKAIKYVISDLIDMNRDHALEIKMLHEYFSCPVIVALDYSPQALKSYSLDHALNLQRIVVRLNELNLIGKNKVKFIGYFDNYCSCSEDIVLPSGKIVGKEDKDNPINNGIGCRTKLKYMKEGVYELFTKIINNSYQPISEYTGDINSAPKIYRKSTQKYNFDINIKEVN